MSERRGNVFVIEEQSPEECDLCGKVAELRPYGPNGENVCFDCGMKNPEAAKRALAKAMDGVSHVEAPADLLARRRPT